MTLQAIIIRADGAFAEIEDLRRQAFVTTFQEAGFNWACTREQFADARKYGSLKDRMAWFVRQFLKRGQGAPDVDQLVAAMHRRACKVFYNLVQNGVFEPRAGMRDLVVAARQEGVRLALAGALKRDEVEHLVRQGLGSRGPQSFDVYALSEDCESGAVEADLYRRAVAELGVLPQNCLVIEATERGVEAAKAAGLPAIMTRSACCFDTAGAGDSAGYFEDLPGVLAQTGKRRMEPLSADERFDLLAALQRLHSGSHDCETATSKGAVMRVSDILKIKGSAVKTIEPTATIRALAQTLRIEAVGAMVVMNRQGQVQGIITERDLARGFAEYGSDLPSMPVSALMTKSLITCAPEDSVAAVAKTMTQRRIRHLPVLVNGQLSGLVSIGDVLKYRLDEVQLEANVLRDFALARK